MLEIENKLEAQKIIYLIELGHSIDVRDWPERRDLQEDYLRQNFKWSFDSAFNFVYAEDYWQLQQAAMIRGIESANQKGGYDAGCARIFNAANEESRRLQELEYKKKREEEWQKFLDGLMVEAAQMSQANRAKKNHKSMVNSQQKLDDSSDWAAKFIAEEITRIKAEQSQQTVKKTWKSGDGFGRQPIPGIRCND